MQNDTPAKIGAILVIGIGIILIFNPLGMAGWPLFWIAAAAFGGWLLFDTYTNYRQQGTMTGMLFIQGGLGAIMVSQGMRILPGLICSATGVLLPLLLIAAGGLILFNHFR